VIGPGPDEIVTLSHPDYNRRPRNYTGSADLQENLKRSRAFSEN